MNQTSQDVPNERPWTRRNLMSIGGASLLALAGFGSTAAARQTPLADDIADAYANPDWLAEPDWLASRLGDPAVKVVALTPAEDFAAGHVPGAAQIDWPALEITDTSDPSIERWQGEVEAILARLGLSPADTVVVYDGGTLFAARLWWILDQLGHADKRILNGGVAAWQESGEAVETGESTAEPTVQPYAGRPNPSALATLDQVVVALDDPNVVLLDARTAGEYEKGHIPGAINVDFPLNVGAEPPHRWKPANELREMYADLGVTPDKTVIPYCSTGVRSAVNYFTLRLIGYPDVALFTGSWKEWSAHPDLPVATGNRP